ncbi:MAG TPA: hypothetical protein VK586_14990 [Streptosporangiaceae bacterium]|nr:hypothetical protein [Streptosporangiaceae bacterium]
MTGPGGTRVDGTVRAGPQDRSWRLVPAAAWAAGTHRLHVDPVLEHLAGNSAGWLGRLAGWLGWLARPLEVRASVQRPRQSHAPRAPLGLSGRAAGP